MKESHAMSECLKVLCRVSVEPMVKSFLCCGACRARRRRIFDYSQESARLQVSSKNCWLVFKHPSGYMGVPRNSGGGGPRGDPSVLETPYTVFPSFDILSVSFRAHRLACPGLSRIMGWNHVDLQSLVPRKTFCASMSESNRKFGNRSPTLNHNSLLLAFLVL